MATAHKGTVAIRRQTLSSHQPRPPVPGERIRDSRGHLRIEDTENAADEQPAALLTAENMQTILDRDLAVPRPAHDDMTVGQLIDDTAHKTTGRRGELESRGPATEKTIITNRTQIHSHTSLARRRPHRPSENLRDAPLRPVINPGRPRPRPGRIKVTVEIMVESAGADTHGLAPPADTTAVRQDDSLPADILRDDVPVLIAHHGHDSLQSLIAGDRPALPPSCPPGESHPGPGGCPARATQWSQPSTTSSTTAQNSGSSSSIAYPCS